MRITVVERRRVGGFIKVIECLSFTGNRVIIREYEDGGIEITKIHKTASQQAVEADAESCGVCDFEFKATGGKYCSNCGRKFRTA